MNPVHDLRPLRYRAIWISDVHLGSRGCQAEFLLDFLHATQCEYLYLVGDILDLWNMKRGLYWPQSHNNVIRTVLGKAKRGTRVIYIPGNHDALLREHAGTRFGNVAIESEVVHTTAAGSRLLVVHGDQFDGVVKCSALVSVLGTRAYDLLLALSGWVNGLRRRLGFSYWSLAAYLKHRMGNARRYIRNFEQATAHEARRRGFDGVVCGHIHRAEMTTLNGALYCNDGDWVESCTALVERHDGELQLLRWADRQHLVKSLSTQAPVPVGHAA
ncbi:MAG TPA: UDP-2,3-diacylglucosamine diphosphatase [Gammaproteobacteria bacterium]|nr:UDP-2,3-diacylglucosamine diphosphatase [Gammaproteobacteria bacterium]